MGSSQADKAASHDRIVKAASRRIRRDGIDKVSVAQLMNQAGLTHGGFYRHFDSRDDLVAEAIDAALAQGSERVHAAAEARRRGRARRDHRCLPQPAASRQAGNRLRGSCAPDRQRPRRRACQGGIFAATATFLDLLAELTPARDRNERHLILAALVGALLLARAVDDPDLSDEILESTARALHSYVDDPR